MRLAIILIVTMVYLLACKKSDPQSNYTGIYISRQFKITSNPKMYTKNGEVTDRASVARYLNALPAGSNYFFSNTDTLITPKNDSIRFITTDTAALKAFNKWEKRVVKPKGDYVYLYPLDTLRSLASSNTNPFSEVVSKIGLYKPYIKTTYYGNLYLTSSYEAAMAQWQWGKLSLPLMNYSLIHNEPNGTMYGIGSSNYNNVFDPSVITFLKDRDTLLIQSFELILEKVQ